MHAIVIMGDCQQFYNREQRVSIVESNNRDSYQDILQLFHKEVKNYNFKT